AVNIRVHRCMLLCVRYSLWFGSYFYGFFFFFFQAEDGIRDLIVTGVQTCALPISTARVDADASLGHPAAAYGMNLAVDKCLAVGVGVVDVFNSHHFGAAGCYSRIAADRGVIGMVTSATRGVTMVPTFGTEPVMGTNPLAFAAPAKRNPPFELDMATTTVAAGKVRV